MSSPVIVFGSINMDLVVYSDKQPAKGETIFGNSFETFPKPVVVGISPPESEPASSRRGGRKGSLSLRLGWPWVMGEVEHV